MIWSAAPLSGQRRRWRHLTRRIRPRGLSSPTRCGRGEFQITGKPPETQDEENGINRGSARQPDPDADSAKSSPEGEAVCGGKSDQPVADRGEYERHSRVVQATKRPCRDRLDAVGDKERRTDR